MTSLIQEYTDAIIENLPEWNHKGAKSDRQVQLEIARFKKLTSDIDSSLSDNEKLKLLSRIIEQYVPDNHVSILGPHNEYFRSFTVPSRTNLAFSNLNALNIERMPHSETQNNLNDWVIGTIKNTKIGVVAIPSFGGNIEEQDSTRQQFINCFFEQKEKHKWQHIIFDFRDNTGGDSEVIREIAERMRGKPVQYANKCEFLDTPAGLKKQKEGYSMPEEQHYQPASPSDLFSGSIYVLQNRYNASAAEGAIFMLSQLKNATTIGENTSGTFSGGATTRLPMTYGSLIIGTEYRERLSKKGKSIKEKIGMKPDFKTSSDDAFSMALTLISGQYNHTKSKGSGISY